MLFDQSRLRKNLQIRFERSHFSKNAIASFLDTEALGFVDCKPGRGQ
ncbi:MAG: hypothetical protein WBL95_17960 [Microcoleus sp.]